MADRVERWSFEEERRGMCFRKGYVGEPLPMLLTSELSYVEHLSRSPIHVVTAPSDILVHLFRVVAATYGRSFLIITRDHLAVKAGESKRGELAPRPSQIGRVWYLVSLLNRSSS